MRPRRAAAVVAAYVLLALIVYPVFPHFVSPNELTRWALASAIVDDHTIEVSRPAARLGPRFEDLAERDGKLYSNKAPGAAFVSLPGYVAARPFTTSIRATLTAMRLVGATLPLLLMALLLIRVAREQKIDEERIATAIWILLFATPLFAYGLLLFSHALVAASLFGAWLLLFIRHSHAAAAGALLGIAVISEYPAAVPVLVIVVAMAFMREWRTLLHLIAGGAPLAALLALYQHFAFGSAFRLSPLYDRLPEYRALGRSGMFGLQMPSIEYASGLLFSPTRGLFVFAPVLILGVVALLDAKRSLSRSAFATMIAIPLSLFLVYTSYPNWHGGWAVGPRYIVACIPFLVFAMLYRERGVVEWILGGWSCAAVVLTTLVFPFPPNAFACPWSTLSLPLIRDGLVAPNLFHVIVRPLAVLMPFAIVLAPVGRNLKFILIGATAAVLAGFVAPRSPVVGLQRDYIADVYFEQEGKLKDAPASLLRRREIERRLPPESWPF